MELNPCGCGSTTILTEGVKIPLSKRYSYYLECDECKCTIGYSIYGSFETKEKATEAWNKLFPLPPDREKVGHDICDLLIRYGPDGHCDGEDEITDYIMRLFNKE